MNKPRIEAAVENLHKEAIKAGRIAPPTPIKLPSDEDMLLKVGFGKRHRHCDFKNFLTTNREVIEKVKQRVVEWVYEKKYKEGGLFLFGDPGTGKTHLIAAAARHIRDDGIDIKRIHALQLLKNIRMTYSDKSEQSEGELLEEFCGYEHLIIDDLGTEKPTEKTIEILNLIINERYEDMKPTSFTSNLGLKAIAEKIGDRIASRVTEECAGGIISFKDIADYRVDNG